MDAITRAARVAEEAELLVGFEPQALSGEDAAACVDHLSRAARLCLAACARAAARVEECGTYFGTGARTGAEWLARKAGAGVGQAASALETAKAVEGLPATKAAYVSGQLSEQQVAVVAKAAAADPSAEASLLDTARRLSLRVLRDQARRVQMAAVSDVEGLHRRQHEIRETCHWTDDEGMTALRSRLPPEVGVPFVNRLEAETDRIYRQAYAEGRREPRAAYMADAFVALVNGTARSGSGRADLVVVVDLEALRRGHTHPGERCHIPGVGPVPVSLARQIGQDAFLKGVLVDGTEIKKVKHYGRHIPAEMRTALELGPVPEFDGVACVHEGCGRRNGLEWDHVDPKANWGPTAYDNLQPRCRPHHKEKTERDRRAGLLQGRDPP